MISFPLKLPLPRSVIVAYSKISEISSLIVIFPEPSPVFLVVKVYLTTSSAFANTEVASFSFVSLNADLLKTKLGLHGSGALTVTVVFTSSQTSGTPSALAIPTFLKT